MTIESESVLEGAKESSIIESESVFSELIQTNVADNKK